MKETLLYCVHIYFEDDVCQNIFISNKMQKRKNICDSIQTHKIIRKNLCVLFLVESYFYDFYSNLIETILYYFNNIISLRITNDF